MAALAVPAPSIIQIGCISVKKAGFFAFFLRFYFLFLLQGKKPFPLRLRPAAHQPQPVRSPSKRAKTQTPRQARRKRYCFGSLIPTTPFCPNKTGDLPFLQQHFFFFSNNRHKNVSFAPRAQEKPAARPKKKSQSHCRDWLFPMAPPTRFERMAFRLGGGRSIHLSYGGTGIFILSYDNWFVNLLWTWPNGT